MSDTRLSSSAGAEGLEPDAPQPQLPPPGEREAACALCQEGGGRVVFAHPLLRLVHAQEPGLEAFYRIVWTAHAREWSDLPAPQQWLCMQAVAAVERAMREVIAPHKVNLASLGNVVPHLHWHIIARYEWDGHFPAPVWAPAHTAPQHLPPQRLQWLRERRPALEAAMCAGLQAVLQAEAPPAA
ncbi:MAG: HIT family protein [Comamonadaceae bacterium]|nr:HIT family protein [Comamonadaceae bacterium]